MIQKFCILALCLVSLHVESQTQLTSDLNRLLPVDLADSRSKIFRSVTNFITNAAEQIKKFNFAVYKKVTANE